MKENKLYLIPTPIGNYDDITIRALDTLKLVDIILCEDTRETGKLLAHYDIKKQMISCHDHNENKMCSKVIELLNKKNNLALVTDQGTPIISDPGYKIVEQVISEGYDVESLPGPTAFVPALTLSALAPQPFLFYGFLNSKKSKQLKELDTLKNYTFTMIFYESPKRLSYTLKNMMEIFGNRKIAIVRELTKKYEEVIRTDINKYLSNEFEIKGEIVLVVEGIKQNYQNLSIEEHINLYLQDDITLNDAMKKVAKERGLAKSIIYKEYHQNK